MSAPPASTPQFRDPIMRMRAYRLALESRDLPGRVVRDLIEYPALQGACSQLLRAAGSIGANIAEGYGRSTGRERAQFFEYALGSVRETGHWFGTLAPFLDQALLNAEAARDEEMIRLLIVMVRRQRALGSKRLGEEPSGWPDPRPSMIDSLDPQYPMRDAGDQR